MQSAIDKYLDQGAVVFPVELIKLSRSSTSKVKKVVRYPQQWQKLTLEVAESRYRDTPETRLTPAGVALLCGEPSGFVVVDVDDNDDFERLLEVLGLSWPNAPMVRSSETSCHLYFKYDERLTKKVCKVKYEGTVYDVDFLTTGANIIAPPTRFVQVTSDEKIIKEYTWQTPDNEIPWFDELPFLPEPLVDLWLTNIAPKAVPVANAIVVRDDVSDVSDDVNEDRIKVSQILSYLSDDRANSYDSWMQVGWCLHNLNLSYYDLWRNFSMRSPKFDEYECQTAWSGMRANNYTMASLWQWLKEDNPEAFERLRDFVDEDTLDFLYPPQGEVEFKYVLAWVKKFVSLDRRNKMFLLHDPTGMNFSSYQELGTIFHHKLVMGDLKMRLSDFIKSQEKHIIYNYICSIPESGKYKPDLNTIQIRDVNLGGMKVLNTFKGLRHKYETDFKVDRVLIAPILSHIQKIFCKGDVGLYNYYIHWLAHVVQKPFEKTEVAIVLISKNHGVGKNGFTEFFGNNVLGNRYFLTVGSWEHLVGKFNSELEHSLFVVLDEIDDFGNLVRNSNDLKKLVTQKSIRIEEKNVKARYVPDYRNFMFLSNNRCIIKVEASDRRFLILDCDDMFEDGAGKKRCIAKAVDPEFSKAYFDRLYALWTSPEVGNHFFHFLMSQDLESFDLRKLPQTAIKKQMQLEMSQLAVRFMLSFLKDDDQEENLGWTICPKATGGTQRFHSSHFPWIDENETPLSSDQLWTMYQFWHVRCVGEKISPRSTVRSCMRLSQCLVDQGFEKTREEHGLVFVLSRPIIRAVLNMHV